MPRNPPLEKLNLATHGQFVTGEPVSFQFMRNTVPAPKLTNNQFGQKEEPAGRFLLVRDSTFEADKSPGWEEGEIRFAKPLVLAWGLTEDTRYTDPDNWKQSLSAAYGGKKGVALTKALLADGFDGIVTICAASRKVPAYVSEIVDLTVVGTPAATISNESRKQVVMYAPCLDASTPETLALSSTGEIGPGLRLYAQAWPAASFGDGHERAIVTDVAAFRFRRFESKEEFVDIRNKTYDCWLLQAKYNKWNADLAAQAEASLVESYRSQGYHGIGWGDEAILFPECLNDVKVLGTQQSLKKRDVIQSVVRSCVDSRDQFVGGSLEDIKEFYAWFGQSATDNLSYAPVPLVALVVGNSDKNACFLTPDDSGIEPKIGTRLDGEYYARIKGPLELNVPDVTAPIPWHTFIRTVMRAFNAGDDVTRTPPSGVTGDFTFLQWLTLYPNLSSLGIASNFDGWKITAANRQKFFLPFDADKQVRPASASYGWQVTSEQEALAYIQKRPAQRKAVLQLPLRFQTDEVWRCAVAQNGEAIEFMPEHFKTAEVCRDAVQKCGIAIYFVPDAHQDQALQHALLSTDMDRDMQLLDWMVVRQKTQHIKTMIAQKPDVVKETRSFLPDNEKLYLDAIMREMDLQFDTGTPSHPAAVRVRL